LVDVHTGDAEHGYRIRYPDPAIKVNDTVKINLATGEYRKDGWKGIIEEMRETDNLHRQD
jgi:hypothetical protein